MVSYESMPLTGNCSGNIEDCAYLTFFKRQQRRSRAASILEQRHQLGQLRNGLAYLWRGRHAFA